MTKFEPAYISYQKRILKGITGIVFTCLLWTVFLFLSGISKYYIAAIILFSIFVLINIYLLFKRSKIYLKSIDITDEYVEVIIVEKNKELSLSRYAIEDTRIKVIELFFNFNRWGRNYKLKIDVRQNGKFETLFAQYEIGKWNLNIFKEIYVSYCKAKKISISTTSLKQTNF